ncbi:uncharacterized [Tachysurus ichikawai]
MMFTSDLVGKTEISECSQTAGHREVQSSALVHPDNLSHSIREPDEISELHITVLSAAGLLPRVSISVAFSSNISIRQSYVSHKLLVISTSSPQKVLG